MARTALLHLVRSQSRTFRSGDRITKVVSWSHASTTKIDASPTTRFASSQIRWASQAALAKDDTEISTGPHQVKENKKEDKDKEVVYDGPQASILKKVKYLSLTSCLAAATVGPIITSVSSLAMAGKVTTTATIILFSIGTTAGLHWFVSPYVHKLRWQPGSDSFEIETMSFLNRPVKRTIKFEDVRPPQTQRPAVSFMANGEFYFVDLEHCHDKALVEKLTPKKK